MIFPRRPGQDTGAAAERAYSKVGLAVMFEKTVVDRPFINLFPPLRARRAAGLFYRRGWAGNVSGKGTLKYCTMFENGAGLYCTSAT